SGENIPWALVAGTGSVTGLVCMYRGLRIGKAGVVAPIAATEGAVAALIAIALGETVAAGAALTLAAIVVGVVLASTEHDEEGVRRRISGAPWAVAAALLFGASLYAIARVGDEVGPVWTIFTIRLIGLALLVLPLAATRRLRLTRPALPFVLGAG